MVDELNEMVVCDGSFSMMTRGNQKQKKPRKQIGMVTS